MHRSAMRKIKTEQSGTANCLVNAVPRYLVLTGLDSSHETDAGAGKKGLERDYSGTRRPAEDM